MSRLRMGHWRQLPHAPGLRCHQALSCSGRTATGAGWSRVDALARCRGELAEIVALEARPAHRMLHGCDESGWTGLAAGQDAVDARRRATMEALERCAVDLWWRGRLPARAVEAHGVHRDVLSGLLARLGRSPEGPRPVRFHLLPACGGVHVAIALSCDDGGGRPVPGYGAGEDEEAAIAHAAMEMAVMELNLIDARPEQEARLALIEAEIRRRPFLFSRAPSAPSSDVGVVPWAASVAAGRCVSRIEIETDDLANVDGTHVAIARIAAEFGTGPDMGSARPSPASEPPFL